MHKIPYTLDDVKKSEEQAKFTVISTFAGGGGSSTGYRLLGGKILAVNEFIEEAARVYAINYPDTPVILEDIRKLSGQDFLDAVKLKKGELDLLDGSPPCASFSMSGIREKGWGKEKEYSDTCQVTDDLFFEFARILKEIQPKMFVAENVKGLTLGGASNILGSEQLELFGGHEETIYHKLTNAGYQVRYKVLNAKYYGVPQSRERLIIVGIRNDIAKKINKPFLYAQPTTPRPIPLREAFEGIENTEKELQDANISRFAIYKEAVKLNYGEQSEKYFSLQKMSPDKYSNTLTQLAGVQSAASIVHWENRKFTVKEALRIMSFPDDYYVGDEYRYQIERLGRAVPPLLYANSLSLLPVYLV